MQHDISAVTILPAVVEAALREAGITEHQHIYLAWDRRVRCLYVVRWEHIRWVCSCGTRACAHQLATNTYVFETSQQNRA